MTHLGRRHVAQAEAGVTWARSADGNGPVDSRVGAGSSGLGGGGVGVVAWCCGVAAQANGGRELPLLPTTVPTAHTTTSRATHGPLDLGHIRKAAALHNGAL